jgi:hypothetical protein
MRPPAAISAPSVAPPDRTNFFKYKSNAIYLRPAKADHKSLDRHGLSGVIVCSVLRMWSDHNPGGGLARPGMNTYTRRASPRARWRPARGPTQCRMRRECTANGAHFMEDTCKSSS